MTRILLIIAPFVYSVLQCIAPAQAESRTIELTYRADVLTIPITAESIALWLPLPASHEFQKVSRLRLKSSHPYEVLIEQKFGNRYLYIEIDNEEDLQALQTNKPWLELSALVTRYAHDQLDSPFTMHNPRGELSRFLGPTKMIPIDGPIAEEAIKTVRDEDDPLKQARLLYTNIVNTVTYDKTGDGWGRGDALYACDVRTGNCSDFHSLFIGEARALNIPARFIMGYPISDTESEGTITGYHCWAEFFVPDKGWVPIDASEAQKYPEKRDAYFGGLDENRVEFTMGRDILLPKSLSGAVNYSIFPHLEINGKANSNIDATVTYKNVE